MSQDKYVTITAKDLATKLEYLDADHVPVQVELRNRDGSRSRHYVSGQIDTSDISSFTLFGLCVLHVDKLQPWAEESARLEAEIEALKPKPKMTWGECGHIAILLFAIFGCLPFLGFVAGRMLP